MKLERGALIAEIIGGIAVVLSLVFVGRELSQSNALNRAATYQSMMVSINEAIRPVYEDAEMTPLWVASQTGRIDELTEAERARVRQVVIAMFRLYDSAFYSYEYSTLGESEWNRIETQVCRQKSFMTDLAWTAIENTISESFNEFIEAKC